MDTAGLGSAAGEHTRWRRHAAALAYVTTALAATCFCLLSAGVSVFGAGDESAFRARLGADDLP
jgi:hypothetical protein